MSRSPNKSQLHFNKTVREAEHANRILGMEVKRRKKAEEDYETWRKDMKRCPPWDNGLPEDHHPPASLSQLEAELAELWLRTPPLEEGSCETHYTANQYIGELQLKIAQLKNSTNLVSEE